MDASSGLATQPEHPPTPGSGATTAKHPAHHDEHGHDHHELPFWRKYIISTDHKVIGIQYGISGLIFLFFGFCLIGLLQKDSSQTLASEEALGIIGHSISTDLLGLVKAGIKGDHWGGLKGSQYDAG